MSLIELLVSVLILSLGLLGLVGLQSRAAQISVEAEDVNRASLLANEVISLVQLNQKLDLPGGAYTLWQERLADPAQGGLPHGTGEIIQETATLGRIVITWRGAAAKNTHQYITHVVL